MTRWAGLLWLWVGLSACGTDRLRVKAEDLPEDTEWVALLGLSEQSTAIDSTPLLPWMSPLELELESDATDEVWLYAFSSADLEAIELPDAETIRANPIRLATGGDPALPAGWVGSGTNEGGLVQVTAAERAQDITVGWLPACPTYIEPDTFAHVDVRCSPPCRGTATQTGCRLSIDLGACNFSNISGFVDGHGRVTTQDALLRSCEPASSPEGSDMITLDCRGDVGGSEVCPFELHPSAEGEPFSLESRQIHDVSIEPNLRNLVIARTAYLMGLVPLDDVVLVGGNRGAPSAPDCPSANRKPGEVIALDAETLQTVFTTTLAECLTALGAHPSDGIVAAIGVTGAQSLVHVSKSGAIVSTTALAAPTPSTNLAVIDIASNSGHVGVFAQDIAMTEGRREWIGGYVFVYDAALTAPVDAPVTLGDNAFRLVAGENDFSVLDRDGDVLTRINVRSEIEEEIGFSTRCAVGGITPRWMSHQRALGTFIAFAQNTSGAIAWLPSGSTGCAWDTFYERPGIPQASVGLREGSSQAVIGLYADDGTDEAVISLFETDGARFTLPSQVVGKGGITEAERDAQGRLWFLLPQDDRVVRAELRP